MSFSQSDHTFEFRVSLSKTCDLSSVHEDDGVFCYIIGQLLILDQPSLPVGNKFCLQLAANRVEDEYVLTNVFVTGTLKDEELVLVERSKDDGAARRTHVLG